MTEALETGDICYSAARELTRVAVPSTEEAWLEAVFELSVRKIEALVAFHLRGDLPAARPSRATLQLVRLDLTPESKARLGKARTRLGKARAVRMSDSELVDLLCARSAPASNDSASRAPTCHPIDPAPHAPDSSAHVGAQVEPAPHARGFGAHVGAHTEAAPHARDFGAHVGAHPDAGPNARDFGAHVGAHPDAGPHARDFGAHVGAHTAPAPHARSHVGASRDAHLGTEVDRPDRQIPSGLAWDPTHAPDIGEEDGDDDDHRDEGVVDIDTELRNDYAVRVALGDLNWSVPRVRRAINAARLRVGAANFQVLLDAALVEG